MRNAVDVCVFLNSLLLLMFLDNATTVDVVVAIALQVHHTKYKNTTDNGVM